MTLRSLWLRIRAIVLRREVDRDLDDELAFHLEMETRKNLAAGMPAAEARRRARMRFGSRALVEDECRDARGIGFLETLMQDIRYALRGFRRSPVFALTVIGTIALGLGLNAAAFTVFNAYVLTPLPVRDASSLYAFTWKTAAGRFHSFSPAEYEQFRRDNQTFSETFAVRKQMIVRIDGHVVFGNLVTGDYFRMLGVEAALGRTLTQEDFADGGSAVVVISHAFWQRHFAADPQIVGRTVVIRGYPCEVAGVLRDRFTGLDLLPHDFWAPVALAARFDDGASRLEIVGRLKQDVSVKAAEAALAAWSAGMTADRPAEDRAVSAVLESRATTIPRTPLTVLLFGPIVAAFGVVMLIACANVANMMLARGLARQREIGIRLSLGAARSRVVRQLLTESVLLSIPAAVTAFLLARATVEIAVRVLFATLPPEYVEYIRIAPLVFDARVFAFMAVAAVASAMLFGLVPALESTRPGLVQAARGAFMYDVRPARPKNALVVVQITASVSLLICAALLLRGANRFANIETGLRTHDVIEIYIREGSRARVLAALESHPVVRAVAGVSSVPLDASPPRVPVSAGGDEMLVNAAYRFASPEFFTVFDIPLIRGRAFTADESRTGAPVAVVSRTTAERLWPGADAVGQSMKITADSRTQGGAKVRRHSTVHVVGVSGDIATGYLDSVSDRTAIFLPASARDAGTVILVRVTGDVYAARRELDEAITSVEPGAIDGIHRMQALVVGRVYPLRVAYWTSIVIGALALLLTISGIYGLLSYVVTQRTKELGIRRALGASVGGITALVLKQSLRLAIFGLAFGVLIAAGASRVFASKMLMVDPLDGPAYAWGTAIVAAACLAAACVPALRAARIDPMITLRHE